MNENKIVSLLNAISKETGGELKATSGNVPLVSSTEYKVVNTDVVLNVKLRKAADASAFNKNISLNFCLPDLSCEPFSIKASKSIFSFLRNSINYKIQGDENQKITRLLISELRKRDLSGVRILKIGATNSSLTIEFKTLYLESLEAMLLLLLKVVAGFYTNPLRK